MAREIHRGLAIRAALALGWAAAAAAQAPSTDVFLVEVSASESGWEVGAPVNVTDREGYDNQPKFLADGGGLLYASQREGQTDVYLHELATGASRQITATPESEYSPTPISGDRISVVRDYGDGVQQLWAFPLGEGEPELLLSHELGPIGYHAWVDEDELILFVLGEPMTLQLARIGATTGRHLADNPGRALAAMPDGGGMSFVHKVGEGEWWVAAVDPESGTVRRLVETRPEREDYAWAPDGSLWMGDGGRLYRWRPGDAGWTMVADLAPAGVEGITRLAFSPDGRHLALVAARPAAAGIRP